MREIRGPRTSKLRAKRRPLKQDPLPTTSAVHLYLYSHPPKKKFKKNSKKNIHTHTHKHTHTDKTKEKPSRAVAFWVIHESHLKTPEASNSPSFFLLFFPPIFVCLIFLPNFQIWKSFFSPPYCVTSFYPHPFFCDWLTMEWIHHHGNMTVCW